MQELRFLYFLAGKALPHFFYCLNIKKHAALRNKMAFPVNHPPLKQSRHKSNSYEVLAVCGVPATKSVKSLANY